MNKKMYSFPFTQDGLQQAKDHKETNTNVKLAVAIIAVIGVTCLVYTAPGAIVAFKPIVVEAAKEALKMTVSGGAI